MLNFDGYAIYLATGATDLRKSISGLVYLVEQELEMDPTNESLYVFCNRARNRLKILQYGQNGYWLYYKALDTGRFAWPQQNVGPTELSTDELNWLVHGLALQDKKSRQQARENQTY